MIQSSPRQLAPLDDVMSGLMAGLTAVPAITCVPGDCAGLIVAAPVNIPRPVPERARARRDGWAAPAAVLAGASSYSPLPLPPGSRRVRSGETLPPECDCVVEDHAIDRSGPVAEAIAEVRPGEGVRRPGEDVAAGTILLPAGARIDALAISVLRAAGVEAVQIRRPRVAVIEIPARDADASSASLIAGWVRDAEAEVVHATTSDRTASSIAALLASADADLVVTVGGTGAGDDDATIDALMGLACDVIHGVAIQPGRMAAAARIRQRPVIACPGSLPDAVAVALLLVLPLVAFLGGRTACKTVSRPVTRKIASVIGLAELVLLRESEGHWSPLAIGDAPITALAQADAYAVIGPHSEGLAPGELLAACTLRGGRCDG